MAQDVVAADGKAMEAFNAIYIRAEEICTRLGVSRVAVHCKQKAGGLPGCVKLQRTFFWDRNVVMPHIVAWEEEIKKRGVEAAQ